MDLWRVPPSRYFMRFPIFARFTRPKQYNLLNNLRREKKIYTYAFTMNNVTHAEIAKIRIVFASAFFFFFFFRSKYPHWIFLPKSSTRSFICLSRASTKCYGLEIVMKNKKTNDPRNLKYPDWTPANLSVKRVWIYLEPFFCNRLHGFFYCIITNNSR